MPPKTRILLQQNNQLKKFFFISPLEDGSICFGSSLPKPNELKIGNIQIPEEGDKGEMSVKFKDAKNIEPAVSKFTYHPSYHGHLGKIQLKTASGEYLYKYDVSRLEDMGDYRKIFVIIPKNPETFPLFKKEKNEHDIIIPIDGFRKRPFCVYVFLCKKDYDWRQLLVKGALNIAVGICENKDCLLIIELFQKIQFTVWPGYTTFIPYIDGVNIEIEKIP